METVDVEIYLAVDGDGNWEVGVDEDELASRWSDQFGSDNDGKPRRVVVVALAVPKPVAMRVEATVPAEPNPGTVRVEFRET